MSAKIQEIFGFVRQGDYARADAVGREALQSGPPTAELLGVMGVIQTRLGRNQEAAHYFTEAQRLDPENPDFILHAAGLAEIHKDYAAALAHHKRVLPLCVPKKSIGEAFAFPHFRTRGDEFPYLNPSFSAGGEDLNLRKIFKNKLRRQEPGFYVDIGAASAVLGSNTYLFYCYGWRGVCIDANPAAAKGFQSVRPRDTFFHCAVTANAENVFFALHKSQNAGMSRIAAAPTDFGADFQPPVEVPGRPLRDILREAVPAGVPIDFMSIDVEGAELDVITSNDWETYSPQVLIVEDHQFSAGGTLTSPAIDRLVELGYAVIGWMPPNLYLERRPKSGA